MELSNMKLDHYQKVGSRRSRPLFFFKSQISNFKSPKNVGARHAVPPAPSLNFYRILSPARNRYRKVPLQATAGFA